MKKAIIILFFGIFSVSMAQTWEFKTGTNSFDGKYATASIIGSGTDFPYTNPVLVVNFFNDEALNFYISQSGYFQDKKDMIILLIFDENQNELYKASRFSLSKDGKIIFFKEFIHVSSREYVEDLQLIQELKKHNKIEIRVTYNYGKNDMKFSLNGSSNAIDKVIPKSYLNTREQLTQSRIEAQAERIRLAREREEKAKIERIRIDSLLLDLGFEKDEAIKTREELESRITTDEYHLEAVYGITTEIGWRDFVQVKIFNKANKELFSFHTDAPKYFQLLKNNKEKKDSINLEKQIKENLKVANEKVLNIVERYQFEEETLNSLINEIEKSYRNNAYNILNIENIDVIKPYKDGKVLVRFYTSDDKWLFTLTEVYFPEEFERKLRINKPY